MKAVTSGCGNAGFELNGLCFRRIMWGYTRSGRFTVEVFNAQNVINPNRTQTIDDPV